MRCRFDRGEFHMEYCTTVGSTLRPDAPAVRLDDCARDRQPEPHAALLRAVEGMKELGQIFRCDANATIAYSDIDVTLSTINR